MPTRVGVGGRHPAAPPDPGSYRLGRLKDRAVEIEPGRVHADFASEARPEDGPGPGGERRREARGGARSGGVSSRRPPGRRARSGRTRDLAAYHFRSGFGLESLDAARRRGIPTICDHSIVHPATLEPLMQNGGRLPAGWSPRKAARDLAPGAARHREGGLDRRQLRLRARDIRMGRLRHDPE